MADTVKTAAEQAASAARGFTDQMGDQARRAGEAMRASGEKAAQGSSAIGLKMLEQAEANTHQAFQAMRAAAQAKDASELMKIQNEYLREQGSRSMNQAREIGDLIMQFGRDAIAGLRQ